MGSMGEARGLQMELACARCGGALLTVRRVRHVRSEPDSEPLCERCIEELCGSFEPDPRDEQPGSRCTEASCGGCGRCS